MIASVFLWVIGPVGRYVTLALVAFLFVGGTYLKIRSDAVDAYKARAAIQANERMQDAIRRSNSVKPSDRVRNDPFCRDCR